MQRQPLTLGKRIKRARQQADLSQEDLAAAVGASARAISDWEHDRHEPRMLGKLEMVLGVSLDEEVADGEMPTPEEVERLRAHMREVLGARAARLESALDAVIAERLQLRKALHGLRRGTGEAVGDPEHGRLAAPVLAVNLP